MTLALGAGIGDYQRMKTLAHVTLTAGLALVLVSCSREPTADTDTTAASAAPPAASPADPGLNALTVDELRAGLSKAQAETRLYAPAGDNAFEYLVALRDKLPGDVGVTSQLIDATPMLIAATEQAVTVADGLEYQRLMTLLRRADSANPAIARLMTEREQAVALAARQQAAAQAERTRELARQQAAEAVARERVQAQAKAAAQTPAAPTNGAGSASPRDPATSSSSSSGTPAAATPTGEAHADKPPAVTRASQQELSAPEPVYPRAALAGGISGEVTVELTVGRDGHVINARVVQSTPRGVFDRAALDAVKQWKYPAQPAPLSLRRTFAFAPGDAQ